MVDDVGTANGEGYTLAHIRQMLGMSRAVVLGYVKDGFVAPTRGPRNAYRFAFQDVVLLRTAQSLRDADIPSRRIRASLRRLRSQLPSHLPLTGLRIVAVGDDIAVREGRARMAADSGQLLFDFEAGGGASLVVRLPRARRREPATTPVERDAIDELRAALRTSPEREDLALELGALLHDARRDGEALAALDKAIVRLPRAAALHFNRAIVLEDLGRIDDALDAYERCLAIDPTFADAHWNIARLHEQADHPQQALRHFSAFRRLQRR